MLLFYRHCPPFYEETNLGNFIGDELEKYQIRQKNDDSDAGQFHQQPKTTCWPHDRHCIGQHADHHIPPQSSHRWNNRPESVPHQHAGHDIQPRTKHDHKCCAKCPKRWSIIQYPAIARRTSGALNRGVHRGDGLRSQSLSRQRS